LIRSRGINVNSFWKRHEPAHRPARRWAEHRVRLSNRELAFLDGGQGIDTVGHTTAFDATVRRLEEPYWFVRA